MSRARKFDWGEAQRRRAAGESVRDIAAALGVSDAAIRRATDPEFLRRDRQRVANWVKQATCMEPDCNNQVTRHSKDDRHRCVACAAKKAATSVRPTTLRCGICRKWKPDAEFPRSKNEKHRRGRHRVCRADQAKMRRDARKRNPQTRERENAKSRERWAKSGR